MKEIPFELLNYELEMFLLPENQTHIIRTFRDSRILDGVLKLENELTTDFFYDNTLIVVIFGDGSVPKRYVKKVYFNNENGELLVETNKKDIKISTMDYYIHTFLIKVRNSDIQGLITAKYE